MDRDDDQQYHQRGIQFVVGWPVRGRMDRRKGQTILEYTVILVVVIGVLVAMKDYIKRGFQGRLKSATDQFGDQYDPQYVNSNILYSTQGNSESIVTVASGSDASGTPGQWTNRVDISNSVESKTGYTQTGD